MKFIFALLTFCFMLSMNVGVMAHEKEPTHQCELVKQNVSDVSFDVTIFSQLAVILELEYPKDMTPLVEIETANTGVNFSIDVIHPPTNFYRRS